MLDEAGFTVAVICASNDRTNIRDLKQQGWTDLWGVGMRLIAPTTTRWAASKMTSTRMARWRRA